jgi:hypothetical protein
MISMEYIVQKVRNVLMWRPLVIVRRKERKVEVSREPFRVTRIETDTSIIHPRPETEMHDVSPYSTPRTKSVRDFTDDLKIGSD